VHANGGNGRQRCTCPNIWGGGGRDGDGALKQPHPRCFGSGASVRCNSCHVCLHSVPQNLCQLHGQDVRLELAEPNDAMAKPASRWVCARWKGEINMAFTGYSGPMVVARVEEAESLETNGGGDRRRGRRTGIALSMQVNLSAT